MKRIVFSVGVASLLAVGGGCSDDSQTPTGGGGSTPTTGGNGGAGGTGAGFVQGGGGMGGGTVECTVPCSTGQICTHGTCVDQQTCNDADDCDFDTYCNEQTGLCEPWDTVMPGADESCLLVAIPGLLSPTIKCEFAVAPANDPFPGHVDVQGTPVVVNFNQPADSGSPSIAASSRPPWWANYTEDLGVIRVLSGDDCTLQANLGGTDLDGDMVLDWTVSSASLAVADLDGDASRRSSPTAQTARRSPSRRAARRGASCGRPPCRQARTGRRATPSTTAARWGGPARRSTISTTTASPEIIREGVVIDATGCAQGRPAAGLRHLQRRGSSRCSPTSTPTPRSSSPTASSSGSGRAARGSKRPGFPAPRLRARARGGRRLRRLRRRAPADDAEIAWCAARR
jgi:hypothetical protein